MSDVRWPEGCLGRWLMRRARARNLAYHPGFRGPFGLRFLAGTNYGGVILASRHPVWSITWTWVLDWVAGGRRPGGTLWEPRWGVRLRRDRFNSPRVLLLGRFGYFSLRTQDSMAKSPGSYGYSRKQHAAYVKRVAERHARAAASRVRAQMTVRLNERGDDAE